jgi:ABC-type multidrug transport system ATPase subunit
LKRPEILIFDEATSHLDTATERVIQRNLRTALVGKTVILVAHRLSTIKDADLIYVLHRGRIVESGTHQHLMLRKGRYWGFWRSQSEEGEVSVPPHPPGSRAGDLSRLRTSSFVDGPTVSAGQYEPTHNGDGHA